MDSLLPKSKVCNVGKGKVLGCGKEKLLEEFYKHPRGKYGRFSQCKACVTEYHKDNKEKKAKYDKQHYQDNKEKRAEQDKQYRKDKPEKILVLANKLDTAAEMANKIRNFIRQWPDWLSVGFDKDKNSQKHYKLNNGSEVKAVATSVDALRGYTPTLLIFDEAAFISSALFPVKSNISGDLFVCKFIFFDTNLFIY